MIAIIAALPREIAALVKGRTTDKAWLQEGVSVYFVGRGDGVVVAAGMGWERATKAVEAALQEVHEIYSNPPDDERHLPDQIISVGLAGSCKSSILPGQVVIARQVVDSQTGERFETADTDSEHILVSVPTIASVQEKRRLGESYAASIVDMEAATVARLALAHGIPFRAIKAVSDAHDFELVGLSRFTGKRGTFRTGAFALYTALRPNTWGKAMTLGKHSNMALAKLTDTVRDILER